jgi:2-amino-4-hydroxy-6-hydroxymethyldihydropteridine diphosphokinase
MRTVFVALGSNLDDPEQQLQHAVKALAELPQSQLVKLSRVYRSSAIGPGEQPDYLNAVARLESDLRPIALLDHLQRIETAQGRQRLIRWGSRTLDLDLLLVDNCTVETPRLTLPHPAMSERNFVLYPLLDVAGRNWMLPEGKELDTLVSRCPRENLEPTNIQLNDIR